MARDLFIDLTNNRLAASETNLAPAAPPVFTKGDNGTFNLYFFESGTDFTPTLNIVNKDAATVKLGIGSRDGLPETGDYTLTFGGDTTSAIPAAATAGQIATAINALTSVISAGGVTVTGALDDHFTIRFATAGTRGSFTADVSQVIPDTVAVIDERLAGSATTKEVAEIQLRLTPAVFQSTWTNLSTTVTATMSTTITGSGIQNEVQRLDFSQSPFAGTYRLTFPSVALTGNTAVTSGIFTTSVTHGLTLNQNVAITGYDTTITGFTRGTTLFVAGIPSPTQFQVASTSGGTAITGAQATAVTTSGIITTFLRQTNTLAASASALDVSTALQGLESIGSGGVSVNGIAGSFYNIVFGGNKGFCDQPAITIAHSLTAKPGKTADVNFATFALRDLVGSSNAVDLDLEIELTDSGTRQTVILSGCSVSEELIDANAFSPVVGYPSYIFQALTAAATNATTSLVAITALNWTAQANSEYLAEWGLLAVDNTGSGADGEISAPTGGTIYGRWNVIIGDPGQYNSIPSNLNSRTQFLYPSDSDPRAIGQKAYIKTGLTSGPVLFKFAKSDTGASIAIQAGSWVRVEKVS